MFRLSGLFPNCLYLIICLIIGFKKLITIKEQSKLAERAVEHSFHLICDVCSSFTVITILCFSISLFFLFFLFNP